MKKQGNTYVPVEDGVNSMVYANDTGRTLYIYVPAKYRLGTWSSDGQCVTGYIFMAVEEV